MVICSDETHRAKSLLRSPADSETLAKKLVTLLDLCVSSLRRGHANLLCIVPILTDDPRRESEMKLRFLPRVVVRELDN